MAPSLILLAACLSAAPAAEAAATNACGVGAFAESARYDAVLRPACHNCYEPRYAARLADALDAVAAIEIDFWDTRDGRSGAQPGAWYVRHHADEAPSGNASNCSAPGDLAACLADVRVWSEQHPGHPPLTVFLDKKEGWSKGRTPKTLDALLKRIIGRERLFAPSDLQAKRASIREAVAANGWPTLAALRGRVIVAMTGGEQGNRHLSHRQYFAERGARALMFLAPDADEQSDITQAPTGYDAKTARAVAFLNLRAGHEFLAPLARARGLVTRVWKADEDDATYRRLLSMCVGFVALYRFAETGFNDGQMQVLLTPVAAPAAVPAAHQQR